MRRWISWLLVAVMLFAFTACSGAPDVSDDGSDTTTTPTLSLAEAYTDALTRYQNDASIHRNIGELQPETQEIIEMDGQFYQSYVASNVDIRYVWLCEDEFPQPRGKAAWDWFAVGTSSEYSLDLLGTVDEGRR